MESQGMNEKGVEPGEAEGAAQILPVAGMEVGYVVLHHTGVAVEHYDLMIAVAGRKGLMTWRVMEGPGGWKEGLKGVERIADHRWAYMTYEGEVRGGRGRVRRVAEGVAAVVEVTGEGMRVRVEGVEAALAF